MPRWSPRNRTRLHCQACGSELVPRSRLPRGVDRVACQNWLCREFDKPVDPVRRMVELHYGPSDRQ